MRKNFQPFLLALLTSTVLELLGLLCSVKVGPSFIPLISSGLALVLLFVWNAISTRNDTKRLHTVTYREYVDTFESQKEFVNSNYERFVKNYERAVTKTRLWMVLCFVLVAMYSFATGIVAIYRQLSLVLGLAGFYLFWGLFAWLKRIPSEEVDKELILDRNEYSAFYSVLDAVFSDEKKKPILVDANGSSFSSVKINNRVVIGIGPLVASILSEEELKQLLIFEKGYLNNKKKGVSEKVDNLLYHHGRLHDYSTQIAFVEKMYIDKLIYLQKYANFANQIASTYYEKLAYQYAQENGDIKVLLSAIMKLRMLFLFETYDMDMIIRFYEPEEIRKDWWKYELKCFYETLAKRKDYWKELIKNELPYFANRNLSFSETLEITGKPEFDVTFTDIDWENAPDKDTFEGNKKKLCDRRCQMVYESNKNEYVATREMKFAKPSRIVENYLKDVEEGKEYSSAELREVLDACYMTCQMELLEKLCRECIDRYGETAYSAHAYFLLGKVLLKKYDRDGIANVYKAVNMNNNYVDDGFDEIETFCSIMGLEAELNNCKNLRIIKLQYNSDNNMMGQNNLEKGDILSEETTLPKEICNANIEEIKRICGDDIEELYQIHKELSEKEFTTVYVVKFSKEISEEKEDELFWKIFNYLDSLEEHYTLCRRENVYIADLPGRVI